MSSIAEVGTIPLANRGQPGARRGSRRPFNRPRVHNTEQDSAQSNDGQRSSSAREGSETSRPPRQRRPPRPRDGQKEKNTESGAARNNGTASTSFDQQQTSDKRRRPPRRAPPPGAITHDETQARSSDTPQGGDTARLRAGPGRSRRGRKFGAGLTETPSSSKPDGEETKTSHQDPAERYGRSGPKKDDLTSRLIHELKTPPYPDCVICFSSIHPAQPTWSCSPLIPTSVVTDDEDGKGNDPNLAETVQCCWTTFHLKCIRSWASKSVKDVEEAWRARGEERRGEWRCPGCQSKRSVVPSSYWCFCGSTPDPKPPRLSTPHSCGGPCTRPRACGHPCPLSCHPGPCPPCQVTTHLPCYCGHETMTFRCANLAPGRKGMAADLSCGKTCGKRLSCSNHSCQDVCHDGPCKPCTIREIARCYCGKEERELSCGEGEEKISFVLEGRAEKRWTGRFQCENSCDRPFDCGIHHCSKPCHPPSRTPAPCPRSPSLVTHCPCGKHLLDPSSASSFPPSANLSRTACTDPVPTCDFICSKPLEGCEHPCSIKCHTGPCPPCAVPIVRPCRCGSTTQTLSCSEDQARASGKLEEVLCHRPCTALRNCGKHQCGRICCPLASLAHTNRGKGKKKVASTHDEEADPAGWHECDQVCGKTLGCGNHQCEERDHRGPCPPCLRSSFEEMVCHCGHTILEPPIPCGTRINCRYACARPPPPCGHPKSQHACHEDPSPCPPCVFLTSKECACGKKTVSNVRCSQEKEKVSCGTTCGRLLGCGFHRCERLCHADACGPCHAVCGKSRRLCLPAHHPCPLLCHAPASCSEVEPCQTTINITCPCGRLRQPVPCGKCSTDPAGREGSQQLKCTNECLVAKRNARLAEALGINADSKLSTHFTYSDELTAFARANIKFCLLVEKTFAEFISSERRSQILPHMPENRRGFVHALAKVYRMDTQLVDQEPHRSVQLLRRIDSRVPTPLLSSVVASSSTPSVSPLGKLADLRAPVPQAPAAGPSRSQTSTPTPSASRGWTSVVARQTPANPSPPPDPAAWLRAPASAPSAQSRSQQPAPPILAVAQVPTTPGAVPDSWEDDA